MIISQHNTGDIKVDFVKVCLSTDRLLDQENQLTSLDVIALLTWAIEDKTG